MPDNNATPDVIPPHLSRLEFNDLEELFSALAQSTEETNEARWRTCDTCAVARHMVPYFDDMGSISPAGRKLVGLLAHHQGCSGQQIRRMIKRAETFPPEMTMDTGEIVILRDMSKPDALFDTAVQWGPRFDLDPVACLIRALDEDWSPLQLRTWIKDHSDDVPPVWRELYSDELLNPNDNDLSDVWDYMKRIVTDELKAFKLVDTHVLSIRFRVDALVPGDPPMHMEE